MHGSAQICSWLCPGIPGDEQSRGLFISNVCESCAHIKLFLSQCISICRVNMLKLLRVLNPVLWFMCYLPKAFRYKYLKLGSLSSTTHQIPLNRLSVRWYLTVPDMTEHCPLHTSLVVLSVNSEAQYKTLWVGSVGLHAQRDCLTAARHFINKILAISVNLTGSLQSKDASYTPFYCLLTPRTNRLQTFSQSILRFLLYNF